MLILNPDKVDIKYQLGTTPTQPIVPRKYTFLPVSNNSIITMIVGLEYAYDQMKQSRDELLASFKFHRHHYFLYLYCYISEKADFHTARKRHDMFSKQIPLALKAMHQGDQTFFSTHPFLEQCPVYIHFDSHYPSLNGVEQIGYLSTYK
ncbi:staygreen family protein [Bacillus sp. CGMCC 1.16541]|uniref:staygreen family protein n=1 Tax=Bacillus sp. CGMCC 1.16541 TaxID=2185143 RepID=UPI0013A58133|nr:staygreen family protein [Bacillus sp. CGMCC 1.16541]